MRSIVWVGFALLLLAGCETEVPLAESRGGEGGSGVGGLVTTGGTDVHGSFGPGGSSGIGTGGIAGAPGSGGTGGWGELDEVIYQPDPRAPPCAMFEAAGHICREGWCWMPAGVQGNDLLDAWATSPTTGWAVGTLGTILHWDGVRWSREQSPTDARLRSIHAGPGGDLWAAGDRGTILRRHGGTWAFAPSPGDEDVLQIAATWSDELWVATPAHVLRWSGGAWQQVWHETARLWSTGPGDVWAIASGKVLRWDGALFQPMPGPEGAERIGGRTPGHPLVSSYDRLFRWSGTGFEQLFESPSWQRSRIVDIREDVDGEPWFLSYSPGSSVRGLHRAEGSEWPEVWREYDSPDEPGPADLRVVMPTGGGTVFLLGDEGRTLRWDGTSGNEAIRPWGRVVELLALPQGQLWSLIGTTGMYNLGYRWDGAGWERTELDTGDESSSLAGTAPNDVWALQVEAPIHWGGSGWSPRGERGFAALFAIAANEVWAVGSGGAAARWDGTTWHRVSTGTQLDLRALWGSRSNDLWAGGKTLLHWDGGTWSVAPGIDPVERIDVRRIAGSGPSDLWAVGDEIRHWNGIRWATVPGPKDCSLVWSGGPHATFVSCSDGFFRREGRGWTRLPFAWRPSAFGGTPANGYAALRDMPLRFCR